MSSLDGDSCSSSVVDGGVVPSPTSSPVASSSPSPGAVGVCGSTPSGSSSVGSNVVIPPPSRDDVSPRLPSPATVALSNTPSRISPPCGRCLTLISTLPIRSYPCCL